MQFVRLVNKDKRPFDFHQSNQKRIIPKGGEIMVPWDIAVSLFGDPGTVDTPQDPARTRAWKQSRGQYGYITGGMTQEEWEDIRPKVEVYDVETNERIVMVIEDPEGLDSNGQHRMSQEGINNANLEQAIAHQQKQIEKLTELLMSQQQGTAPTGQAAVASQDGPSTGTNASTADPLPPAEPGEDKPQAVSTGKAAKADKGGATHLPPKPDLTA